MLSAVPLYLLHVSRAGSSMRRVSAQFNNLNPAWGVTIGGTISLDALYNSTGQFTGRAVLFWLQKHNLDLKRIRMTFTPVRQASSWP